MLDRFILKTEFGQNYLFLLVVSFGITMILAGVNYFIGGNSLFLVALVSLSLAYPVTNYVREMDRKMVEEFRELKSLLSRYQKELILFWTIFIGVLFGFYAAISLGLVTDLTSQEMFTQQVSGNISKADIGFVGVLINNIQVDILTFIISFLVFSGLIFVLIWNASILGYYLFNLGTLEQSFISFLALLPHGLLEIGGYVFAGIAGAILAYRIDFAYSSKFYKVYDPKTQKYILKPDRRNTFNKVLNKRLFLDFTYLLLLSFGFVLVGAFIETIGI